MSTISAAVSRMTDCQECYWINQSLLPSGGLRSVRASIACAWFFGTKEGGGSFHFVRCIFTGRHEQDGVVANRLSYRKQRAR